MKKYLYKKPILSTNNPNEQTIANSPEFCLTPTSDTNGKNKKFARITLKRREKKKENRCAQNKKKEKMEENKRKPNGLLPEFFHSIL